jgi:hypothetical protein
MNLGEKILLAWLLSVAWLIPVISAWPYRYVSPLWAGVRIASAAVIFSVLELWIWRPQTPHLETALCLGVVIYLAKFFIKRKLSSPQTN